VSCWEQVGSVDDARRAVDDGADVLIAQGYEAGGHNYQGLAGQPGLPTFVLLPTLVDAVGSQAMVLGSGGISDGRGVAAALALGADAVWVGTRMVATTEASVHDEHKRRIVAAKGEDHGVQLDLRARVAALQPDAVAGHRCHERTMNALFRER
jgi:NAD(P)H-dependent flavin oxidoreductase YrpB (nitropropane dioxygenase family)